MELLKIEVEEMEIEEKEVGEFDIIVTKEIEQRR